MLQSVSHRSKVLTRTRRGQCWWVGDALDRLISCKRPLRTFGPHPRAGGPGTGAAPRRPRVSAALAGQAEDRRNSVSGGVLCEGVTIPVVQDCRLLPVPHLERLMAKI